MNKVTWNDLHEGHQEELKKTYNLDSRGLEKATRQHWDGASPQERRQLYEMVFGKRR